MGAQKQEMKCLWSKLTPSSLKSSVHEPNLWPLNTQIIKHQIYQVQQQIFTKQLAEMLGKHGDTRSNVWHQISVSVKCMES